MISWNIKQKYHIIKSIIDEFDCIKSVKRKHISFINFKWGYRIGNTDFYLICKRFKREKTSYYSFSRHEYKWTWLEAKSDYCGNVNDVRYINFDDVFNSSLPKEILFNLDVFQKLAKVIG